MEKQPWPIPTNRFMSSGDDSIVPTGLAVGTPNGPGTEVPGYSRRVPNGTQLSSPHFRDGELGFAPVSFGILTALKQK